MIIMINQVHGLLNLTHETQVPDLVCGQGANQHNLKFDVRRQCAACKGVNMHVFVCHFCRSKGMQGTARPDQLSCTSFITTAFHDQGLRPFTQVSHAVLAAMMQRPP